MLHCDSQFSLCSHYLDVADPCLIPDGFGKEAVLGSKWLSLNLIFVVPLPIFGGFQKNVLGSLFLSLMWRWWPLVRIRQVGSWDFVRLSTTDFNINIRGLGTRSPKGGTPFLGRGWSSLPPSLARSP